MYTSYVQAVKYIDVCLSMCVAMHIFNMERPVIFLKKIHVPTFEIFPIPYSKATFPLHCMLPTMYTTPPQLECFKNVACSA